MTIITESMSNKKNQLQSRDVDLPYCDEITTSPLCNCYIFVKQIVFLKF